MDATTAPAPTDIVNGRTVADWHAEAERLENESRDRHRRSSESFDRCDTDGWATQAALDITGREYKAKAERARNLGYVEINVLTDLNGRIISTRQRYGQHGAYWIVDAQFVAEQGLAKPFVTLSKARDTAKAIAADARKGVRLARARVFGHVKVAAPEGARGFAGMASCYIDSYADRDALATGSAEVTVTCLRTLLAEENDAKEARFAALRAENTDPQF